MDVPLYYTLAYFGSGYSVLSFAWRVSQVFQAVFSALFSSLHVSASLQPLAGFPSASRPVQFAPTWWDPSHRFGKRRKKKNVHSHVHGKLHSVPNSVRVVTASCFSPYTFITRALWLPYA